MQDGGELTRLQELHDDVYEQARVWFQNLKIRFRNQILQHFGPMPEREADIQVNTELAVLLLQRVIYSRQSLRRQHSSGRKQEATLSEVCQAQLRHSRLQEWECQSTKGLVVSGLSN